MDIIIDLSTGEGAVIGTMTRALVTEPAPGAGVLHDRVGVSPKVVARIVRFRALVDALRSEPAARWAEFALRLGFYDQSHLVREVRAFADLTPGALLDELR